MEYFRAQDTYLVRLDPEEEILTQLHALAEKERIQLAEVSGLGVSRMVAASSRLASMFRKIPPIRI